MLVLPMQVASASSRQPGHTAEDLHDMPETSDRDAPAQPDTDPPLVIPASDAHEREATELAAVRRQYSRASSHRRPSEAGTEREPATPFGRLALHVSKFWGRQVSIIVPHVSCRDHLGTAPFEVTFAIRFL